MAQATCNYSRFHNFSDEALADAIGNGNLALKAREAEVKAPQRGVQAPRPAHGRRRALHRHPVGSDFQPPRRRSREAVYGRRVASFRNDEHHHRHPHQGRPAARHRRVAITATCSAPASTAGCLFWLGGLGVVGGQGLAQRLFLTNSNGALKLQGSRKFIRWRFFGD